MNEAIGKLRLLELEPLKLAAMDAFQRAWSFMPPLHVQSKRADGGEPIDHGFERRVDLQRAIDCLAIDDTDLRQLCDEFVRACEAAGKTWFQARKAAEAQGGEVEAANIKAVYAQPPFEGDKAVKHIRDLYVKLSQHIEKLVR
ncbi:MAG: hypothetical protein ACREJ3_10815 [Polyangiaceae bacterium]